MIKQVNRELKNKPLYFTINPGNLENISYIKVTADLEQEVVKKVVIKLNGYEIKLNKADYTAEFSSEGVLIKGRRNMKGEHMVHK